MADLRKRNQAAVRAATHADEAVSYDQGLRSYMLRVYNYMAGGLAVSGVIAYLVASSPALVQTLFGNQITALLLAFAPIIFVLTLSFRIHKMSLASVQMAFWGFAALMGVSLSVYLLAYTGASVVRVFLITAAAFGALSLYGYTTKRDLSGMGAFLFAGLLAMIVASIVNIFLKSSGLEFAMSMIGVVLAIGLTAYDTQRIKQTYYQLSGEMQAKAGIYGALQLYMDFIYLMINLLRLMGDRR